MSPWSRRLLAVALVFAPLALAAGCDLVLGIPSKAYDATNVSRTCECPTLELQRLDFKDICAEDIGPLVDPGAGDTERATLLALAGQGCDDCANVTACYAAITSANEPSEACEASSDCASWACCGGEVELVYDVDTKRLEAVSKSNPSCCPAPNEGESACSSCGTVYDDLADGVQTEVPCVESLDILLDLADCIGNAAIDPRVGCVTQCKAGNSAPGTCARCVLKKGLCEKELSSCQNDRSRPIYPSGSE